MKSKISKFMIDSVYILLGTAIMAIAINVFLLPNKITTGGASGVGTIMYYLFNINISLTVLIVNIPLFIIAFKKLGFKFVFKTLVATSLFTLFLEVLTFNEYLLRNRSDMFISSIYGGMLLGIGMSLVFKANASSGGTDLLAQIIRKKNPNANLSKTILLADIVIIAALIITFKDINLGLYSAIAIYISTKFIDIVFEGINYTKVINIITKNDDAIPNAIMNEIKRGATVTKCIGAYTRDEHINVTCIVTNPEIAKVKSITHSMDPEALIYITNTHEVLGKGFKIY